MSNSGNTTQIRIASTEKELEAICRFRYQRYVVDMGITSGNKSKESCDTLDRDETTVNFYCTTGDKILGVLRVNSVKRDDTVISLLDGLDGIECAEMSRFMVEPGCAVSGVGRMLIEFMFDYLNETRMRVDLLFLTCMPGLYRFYKKIGMRQYTARLLNDDDGLYLSAVSVLGCYEQYCEGEEYKAKIANYVSNCFSHENREVALLLAQSLSRQATSYYDDESSVSLALSRYLEHDLDCALQSTHQIEKALTEAVDGVLSVPTGKLLSAQNLEDSEAYFICRGEVTIFRDDAKIATGYPGDVVGEMSFFDKRARRSATMRIEKDAELLVIRRGDLARILRKVSEHSHALLLLFCKNFYKKLKM